MRKFSPVKVIRSRERTTEKDCGDCSALCCHDLSVTITRPRTRDEIDELKWQIHFDNVGVYIRSRRWHLIIKGRCQFLDKRDLCTIYDSRPDVCREHMPPDCERFEDWYDILFTRPEEIDEYLGKGKRKKGARKRSGKG